MKRHFLLVEEQHCDSHYCEIVHLRSAHDAGEKDLLIDGVSLRESVSEGADEADDKREASLSSLGAVGERVRVRE